MNVTLPKKNKIKKKQLILYITIIAICIISIIIALYVEFYARIDIGSLVGIEEEEFGKKTEEEEALLKDEFNQIFNNSIEDDNRNDNKKIQSDKSIVYTKYEKKESKLNSYDLEVHIPYINIENEVIEKYNTEIEEIFVKIANNVLQSEKRNIVYTVEYASNIQDDILSIVIKSNFKEGSNAQKVIIQTYCYDLRNNKEMNLEEILRIKNLDKQFVQNKINSEIAIEQKKVEDLKKLGYNIYSRDTSSDIYTIENSTEFYLIDNAIYIIYAYGNETNTSEMDLVVL